MIEKESVKAYALENAIKHKGKAQQGAVLSSLFSEGLDKSSARDMIPLIAEVLEEVNSLSLEEQKSEYEKLKKRVKKRKTREAGELPELPDAEIGKVVMRVAPFPSGPLHIGNARQVILNDEYVKKYSGRFLLVMDDTIGSEEKQIESEAYDLIKEGIKWLGAECEKTIYKSDRNEIYYKYAEELIEQGHMYVCGCSQEKFHEYKESGVDCPCRHLPSEIQIKRWKKMFSRKTKSGALVVRLKTSMQDPDPAFRDRVMLKISERAHPRTKKKYRVYPAMEFSWAIDDWLFGVTHVLRGIEHQMSTKVQEFIRNLLKVPNPVSIYSGHFQIEGVKISKSKGAKEVKSGQYIGWNDPRLWSLQSLRERGILPEAVREFLLSQGITKSNSKIAIDVLYALNRKYLEDCKRYFFVPEPVKIKISGAPNIKVSLPLHPTKDLGSRVCESFQEFYIPKQDYDLMKNNNYRLMHLLNFNSSDVLMTKPRYFSFISEEPDTKLDAKFIQWLPAEKESLKISVMMPDGSVVNGLGEMELKKLKKDEIVQFERFGFAKLHLMNKKENKAEFWFTHR